MIVESLRDSVPMCGLFFFYEGESFSVGYVVGSATVTAYDCDFAAGDGRVPKTPLASECGAEDACSLLAPASSLILFRAVPFMPCRSVLESDLQDGT